MRTTALTAIAWLVALAAVPGFAMAEVLGPRSSVAVVVLVALVPLVLGALVTRGAPGNWVGPLLAWAGAVLVLTNVPASLEGTALDGAWMLLYLPLGLTLMLVPDGHPPAPRWRWLGIAFTAVVALFAILTATPLRDAPNALILGAPFLVAFLACLVGCAAAPFARYRNGDEPERLRLRWMFLAGLSLPLTLLLCWASYLILGGPDLVAIGLVLMYLAIPAGAAVAVLAPTLFDVDRATVATVTGTIVAALVLTGLSIASISAGSALIAWNPVAALVLTAALAAGAATLTPWLRRRIERALYPERGRALAVLAGLRESVEAGVARPEEVEAVLREALRDPGLLVAYRRLADHELVLPDGAPAVGALATTGPQGVPTERSGCGSGVPSLRDASTATTSNVPGLQREVVPILARGEEIGALLLSPGRVKHPPSDVLTHAAPLVDAARLRAEVSWAMADVQASRERALRAGYEERRRLERDLHDGAQQRLVALGMQLRVLQRQPEAPARLAESLDTAVAELGTAVAELRRIAHGLRPQALDDGLGPALADLVRLAPDTIELDIRAGDLPDAVATTAYFVVSEALTNALRHAAAQRVHVAVRTERDALLVTVTDDGRGAALPAGGLVGLADRVDALGGSFAISSEPGVGTRVEAVLPCGS